MDEEDLEPLEAMDQDDGLFEGRFIQEDALLRASRDGSFNTLKSLVERGADVNFSTPLGNTPLMIASMNGYGRIVQYLVEHGADLERMTEEGNDALIYAIRHEHEEIAVYLIEQGAPLDSYVLLTLAIQHGEGLVIKTLVEHGMEVSTEELELAVALGDQQILEYLIEHTTTEDFPIPFALREGKLSMAKYLVNEGGEIRPRYPNYIKEYSKDLKLAQEQVLDDLLSRPSAEPALKKSIQRFLKNK